MLVREVMDKYQSNGMGYLGIDRVVIGIPFKHITASLFYYKGQASAHDEEYAEWKAQVAAIKYIEYALTSFFKVKAEKIQGTYLRRIRVFSDESNRLLMVVILGKTPTGIPVLNFEFNPSKLSQYDWDEVEGGLTVLLDHHYAELYQKGVVSHFEFFIDMDQHAIGDLVLLDLGRRTRSNSSTTTYSGKRAGRMVGTMYDKAAELGRVGNLVRIEARINRRDLAFHTLVEGGLSNPFTSFIVVPAEALATIAAEWKQPYLEHHLCELGLYEVVKNPHARKKIASRLGELAMPWWKPEAYWHTFSQMLLHFRPPNLMGGAAGVPA